MRPMPFQARFIPRTEGISRLMEKEAEEAGNRLKVYDGETKVKAQDFFRRGDVYDKS